MTTGRQFGTETLYDKKKPSWLGFDTSHDVNVRVSLDFSTGTSLTLVLLGLMGVFAVRRRRGGPPICALSHSAPQQSAPGASPPGPPQAVARPYPSPLRSAFRIAWNGVAVVSVSIVAVAAGAAAVELRKDDEDDATLEDAELIGSRHASLSISWPETHAAMVNQGPGESFRLTDLELGGKQWRVEAEYRRGGSVAGFYLMHHSGTKDQIAFSITVLDVSGDGRRVLAEERHGGDWVVVPAFFFVLPGFAADGRGASVSAARLRGVERLRLEFEALGPATEYRNAI